MSTQVPACEISTLTGSGVAGNTMSAPSENELHVATLDADGAAEDAQQELAGVVTGRIDHQRSHPAAAPPATAQDPSLVGVRAAMGSARQVDQLGPLLADERPVVSVAARSGRT